MAYEKTNWINGVTPTSAENLNKIEDELGNLDINKADKTETDEMLEQLRTGWCKLIATFTFESFDSTVATAVINTDIDLTNTVELGDRLKFTQDGAIKYGIVTAKTSTQLTLYLGTDFTLTNTSIIDVYFSHMKTPFGFPMNPDKWSVTFTKADNTLVTSPNTTTWYMGSTYNLDVPIGMWDLSYEIKFQLNTATQVYCFISLSTSSTGVSDTDFDFGLAIPNTATFNISATKRKNITLSSKTKYYAIFKNDTAYTNLYFTGGGKILAVCAYL